MLQGKCVLITGSDRGLGLETAERFAEAGCNVVLNGLTHYDAMAAVTSSIEDRFKVGARYFGADLTKPEQIAWMVSQSTAAFGSIDIMINNAVVRHAAPIEDFPIDKWNDCLAVNLSAAFHTIRMTLPLMRKVGWGRIINVSSIYGTIGAVDRVGYVTSKTALIGLTRAVALETTGVDITCNAVCPGTVQTPVHDATIRRMSEEQGLTEAEAEDRFLAGKHPAGRFVAAADVAALMLFLCGPASRDITGAALPIDGGWSIN